MDRSVSVGRRDFNPAGLSGEIYGPPLPGDRRRFYRDATPQNTLAEHVHRLQRQQQGGASMDAGQSMQPYPNVPQRAAMDRLAARQGPALALRPSPLVSAAAAAQTRQVPSDIKEQLKLEMFHSDEPACDNHFQKNVPCPDGTVGYIPAYVVLDSWYKKESLDPADGLFGWNTCVASPPIDQESFGTYEMCQNVVRAIVSDFAIQLLPAEPYTTNTFSTNPTLPDLTANTGEPPADPLAEPRTQIPFANKIFVEVLEWAQCYYTNTGRRFHFCFNVAGTTDNNILLTPAPGFDRFIFADPQMAVQGLTLRFLTPDRPISFLQDVMLNVTVVARQVSAGVFALAFQYPNHGLSGGTSPEFALADRVMIFDIAIAATTSPSNYAAVVLSYLNNPAGFIVGVNGLSANEFQLNPTIGATQYGVTDGTVLGSVTVRVAARRMLFPLRMDCVAQRVTNYLDLSE